MITVKNHFNKVAESYDAGKAKYSYYYSNLKSLLAKLIAKNKKMLEVGCGTGDLVAYLHPNQGYGLDISQSMIRKAKYKYGSYKNLHFSIKWPSEKFDYIFMSDVIEHLTNPEKEFKKIFNLLNKKGKFIITMANPIWEPLLMIWEKMGWKMPEGPHNRIKNYDLRIILKKSGFKILKHDYKLLVPIDIPIITTLMNRFIEKYLKKYAFIEYFVATKG